MDEVEQDKQVMYRPGRDLDIKVALEVMGYIWLKHLLQFSAELAVKWLGTAADIEASGGVYVAVKPEQFWALKERENYAEAVPPFSTDMAAAEQVIETMKSRGCSYELGTTGTSGDSYAVTFSRSGDGSCAACGTAIPEAVAKAALAFAGQYETKTR